MTDILFQHHPRLQQRLLGLLIEDREELCTQLRRLLHHLGDAVAAFHITGNEAVAAANQEVGFRIAATALVLYYTVLRMLVMPS